MGPSLTRWLLDGNVVIDALAGLPHAAKVLHQARNEANISILYSAITRIEVLAFPSLTAQEETAIQQLLDQFEEVAVTNAVIERAILIRKAARIKIPDALIAASAHVHQAIVITRNVEDFARVPDLKVLHPDRV